ncbi:YeeE/YedE family protein [Salinivibrio kushneri]|uniref:YeeE/YedE family protein n=1 Tax=Salinivibrio kushneri TaxID=1908198 RepID=UPI0022B3EB0C|nr:YeeE/YedE family protein [Salinivibrio kushneri]WBA13465.1 YeeE/YedE family protein [Salinivibrio kushneri]
MTFPIPWDALFGGMLVGAACLALLALNGRIAGISGIVSGALSSNVHEAQWRGLFLLGMVSAGILMPFIGFELPNDTNLAPTLTPMIAVLAGLLVGIGTRLGNGCTSGHGICGMGRLSKRSIVATLTFMSAAFVTVFVRFHL